MSSVTQYLVYAWKDTHVKQKYFYDQINAGFQCSQLKKYKKFYLNDLFFETENCDIQQERFLNTEKRFFFVAFVTR